MVRWRGRRESENVEDRRGQSGGFPFPFPLPRRRSGGRRMRLPLPRSRAGRRGGMGVMGLLVVLGLMLFFGVDPRLILGGGGMPFPGAGRPGAGPGPALPGGSPGPGRAVNPREEALAKYVKVILADTEDVWNAVLPEQGGRSYREPKLVLFTGAVPTACGYGQAAMGPFYCPLDQKIYIDLGFYDDLKTRFGARGDFAQAYVVAHEVGHHVQKLLGIADKVAQAKRRLGPREANRVQVRMELQADCLAGVWANRADRMKGILEKGDIEEGLGAAAAIGDDRIQRRTQGRVVRDAFTHGSSAQRVRWFRRGLEEGRMAACNTFSAARL